MGSAGQIFGDTAGLAGAGAAIGAPFGGVGAGIGAGIGGLIGLGEGIFGDSGQDALAKQQQLYQNLLDSYSTSPEWQQAMGLLQRQATTSGLTPEAQNDYLLEQKNVNDMLHGQEGAIQSRALSQLGGAGMSGMQSALQMQAAQNGASTMAQESSGAMAQAQSNRQQALAAYLEGAQRNQDALNQYRIAASGMLGGAYGTQANYNMANQEATNQNVMGGAALGYNAAKTANAPPSGGQLIGGNTNPGVGLSGALNGGAKADASQPASAPSYNTNDYAPTEHYSNGASPMNAYYGGKSNNAYTQYGSSTGSL